MKILTEEGRECTPNDPKCSWQPAGVKLKGLALKPEAENNELCKERFENLFREKKSTKQIFKPTKTMVIPELQYTDRLNLKQWPNAGRKRRDHGRKWLTPYIFES